jgi:hypothetical protein
MIVYVYAFDGFIRRVGPATIGFTRLVNNQANQSEHPGLN